MVLSVAQLVNAGTGSVGNILIMSGHQQFWFLNSLSMAVVNVALNWILIPRLGIQGAAIATAISIAGLFVLGLIEARLLLRVFPYDRRYLKGVAAGVVAASFAALVRFTLLRHTSPTVSLFVSMAVILGAFVFVLIALGLDREDRMVWKALRRRLRSASAGE